MGSDTEKMRKEETELKTHHRSDAPDRSRGLSAAFILVAFMFTIFAAVPAAAAGSGSITIPVRQSFAAQTAGDTAKTTTVIYLLAEKNNDGSYSIGGVDADGTFSMEGNEETSLTFTFSYAGIYSFSIGKMKESTPDFTLDASVYDITLYVKNGSDGLLVTAVSEDAAGLKTDEISFRHIALTDNTQSYPDSPQPTDPPHPTDVPTTEPTKVPSTEPTATPTIPTPTETNSYPDSPNSTATATPTVPTVTKAVTYPAADTTTPKTAGAETGRTTYAAATSAAAVATGDTDRGYIFVLLMGASVAFLLFVLRTRRKDK